MKIIYLIFFILSWCIMDSNQQCGATIPFNKTDCQRLNNNFTSCCYLTSKVQAISYANCFEVSLAVDWVHFTSLISDGLTYTVDCGTPSSTVVPVSSLCGTQTPYNSTDCYSTGGANCCIYTYNRINFCLDKSSQDTTVMPYILNQLKCGSLKFVYSLFILFVNIIYLL